MNVTNALSIRTTEVLAGRQIRQSSNLLDRYDRGPTSETDKKRGLTNETDTIVVLPVE
jgi:hypothetical protein